MCCPLSSMPTAREKHGRKLATASGASMVCFLIVLRLMSNMVPCSFLDTLFVAIDANFRLKRKNVSSHESDPGLSKGLSYFVEDTRYREHIKNYISEAELVSYAVGISFRAHLNFVFRSRKARAPVMTP